MTHLMKNIPVLIVGEGPAGLSMALCLARGRCCASFTAYRWFRIQVLRMRTILLGNWHLF
jgi:hypothetical protein